MNLNGFSLVVGLGAWIALGINAFAQGTAFTYQGRLTDGGSLATNTYDMRFTLYGSVTGGTPVGCPLTNAATPVSNGLFGLLLDFGAGAFPGTARWLEIAVRPAGSSRDYQSLAPRQQLSATPYATRAANFSGVVSDSQLSANVSLLNADQTFSGAVTFSSQSNNFTGRLSGNGAGLTNLVGAQKAFPVVTVSPVGLANGYPSNNLCAFGPDTPGTTTCGIQEAINALPIATNRVSPGGGEIRLAPGVFYTTSTIKTINNTNPFFLTIQGPGENSGGIVYVGASPASVIQVGVPRSLNSVGFAMRDLWVSALANVPTNLVWLWGNNDPDDFTLWGGVSKATIERCWFGWWPMMTNNPVFGLVLARLNDDTYKHNLIAVDADCTGDEFICIENSDFSEVLGIGWRVDHGIIRGNHFANCGVSAGVHVNDWPSSSPFSCGAVITIHGIEGNEVWDFSDNYFINSWLCYFAGTNPSLPLRRFSYNDQIESGRDFVATAGNPWVAVNPRQDSATGWDFTNNWVVTNLNDFSTWRTNPDTTNAVRLADLYSGQFGALATRTIIQGNAGSVAGWPSAASSPGGWAIAASNHVVYLLTSTPGHTTWAATNKLGP